MEISLNTLNKIKNFLVVNKVKIITHTIVMFSSLLLYAYILYII